MRYLLSLTTFALFFSCLPVQALEIRPLADCAIKVFRTINRNQAWSGKPPDGCMAGIHVEKRPEGVFVTTWNSGRSEAGWVRLSLSSAMGFYEIADRKLLKEAASDISARAARIERCLDSIIRVNDPLECRDHATKTYSAGEEFGVEYKRNVWLDDNGRHSVVEHAYGNTRVAVGPPADLFDGPAWPPGTELKIHVFDNE